MKKTEDRNVFPLSGARGSLKFEYLHCINYAMVMNGRNPLIRCVVENSDDGAWHDVEIEISGDMIAPSSAHIDCVKPQSEFDVADSVQLNVDTHSLINLTEGIDTEIKVRIKVGEKEILRREFPVYLMAYDQWTGSGILPELLASFVTPNLPQLTRVNVEAARLMEKWTGRSNLDEYQSQDPNRVRHQVAAIYEALRGEGIVYATPPASFEEEGQRIRLSDQVLSQKLGTCIDLSLLVASCLEAIGINPILILTRGHCLVGAWLVRDSYGKAVGDDVTFLLKSAADGINEIVAFEATSLTSSEPRSFDEAVSLAMQRLREEEGFEMFIDVYRARVSGIRPLPARMARDGVWVVENEGVEHESATTTVRQYDRYDLEAYSSEGAKSTKLQLWERKLLDFSLRNNLLNMKLGRKLIPIVSFSIDRLEDKLQDGLNFQVLPCPLQEGVKPKASGMYDSSLSPNLEEFVSSELSMKRIHSFLSEDDLKEALKYVYRASRTSLEENGANNLYLVLGLLQWHETDSSVQPRYAPILLLPIEIVRSSGMGGYVIRNRDEEIVLNITMTEILKQQHGIDLTMLSDLPKDDSGVDVKRIFAIIRDKIKEKRGWNVLEEAAIGLFSFSKFVMWNDIHSNSDKLRENKVVSSLIEGKLNIADDDSEIDAKDIDRDCKPAEFTIPVDVDSSQLEAIVASGKGKSFILHGPPGTGKSQTITNIIANALYQGKRVLFVAEKMAALSVVQSRLEKIGLAPFCLELHSNKVTKQHFLKQMETALSVAHSKPAGDFLAKSEELFESRKQLLRYIEALHEKQSSGLSLYDCISAFISCECDEMDVSDVDIRSLTKEGLDKLSETLSGLDSLFRICGHPSGHVMRGLDITDGSAEAEETFAQAARDYLNAWQAWQRDLETLSPYFTNGIGSVTLDAKTLTEIKDCVGSLQQYYDIRESLRTAYTDLVLDLRFDEIKSQWGAIQQKWFLPRYFAKKAYLKSMRHYNVRSAEDVEAIIDGLFKIKAAEKKFSEHSLVAWLSIDKSMIAAWGQLVANGEAVQAALSKIRSVANIQPDLQQEEMKRLIADWAGNIKEYRNWYLWCSKQRELTEAGFACAVRFIIDGKRTGSATADILMKSLYHAIAVQIINSSETLRYFNGELFSETIAKYQKLTARFQELSKQELYCKLAAKIPSTTNDFADSSEPGILKRNIKNGGRGTSIRKIIDQIPNLLPRLCPCMLMSPISVAQYIDLSNEKFDLVIFDEASQMPTSEAVGAIARGNALVVVGDPKQMPPTSFFSTSQVDEDEADIDDMESILDDCISLSLPSKYLTWHYRSKHESLIAFSNSQYYDGKLFTFPSVDDQVSKITLHHIDGVYDKGKSRSNKAEAEAIVREVIRRYSDPVLSKKSIGIVSFSKVQQNLIEDLLCAELAKNAKLEALAYESEEPIFIKNLENVQGDERDVILFSVGYGPDKTGKVSMNFGPLNNAGGERRLNVAVSRARYEMVVFSTLTSEQIDLRRTQALGVEGLKKFLEFAEKGRIPETSAIASADSDHTLINDIAKELTAHGYSVKLHIGRSQFKVDIAVQDPKNPSNYLLGILCDGKSYYSTKTVRDREVVQPSVLRMLKWNIMHVWSVDWFERRQKVMDAILEKLRNVENAAEIEEQAPIEADTSNTPAASVQEPAETLQAENETSPCMDYEFAAITATGTYSEVDTLFQQQQSEIKKQLKLLIEKEAPITNGLLYKRIVKAWGLTRITPKAQSKIDDLIKTLKVCSTNNNDNGVVYWSSADAPSAYSSFRNNSDRDIKDVPYVEIENAMKYVITQQIAMDKEDLKRMTAQQLGYTRKGNNIDYATEHVLQQLSNQGFITIADNKVSKS